MLPMCMGRESMKISHLAFLRWRKDSSSRESGAVLINEQHWTLIMILKLLMYLTHSKKSGSHRANEKIEFGQLGSNEKLSEITMD